jgi:hypothetical protein
MPLHLSDREMDIVWHHARPLDRDLQAPFVSAVAHALASHQTIGPGLVARTCAELQRYYWHPTAAVGTSPKYR